ncbi:uncharacterized protein METZ01_LOCUS473275 [marine metagenome]|uniref:Uncharacterized protein n=1 Tax=marine metagenome TaxID=408172 RepID=A0A383BKR3_9ZZZZ
MVSTSFGSSKGRGLFAIPQARSNAVIFSAAVALPDVSPTQIETACVVYHEQVIQANPESLALSDDLMFGPLSHRIHAQKGAYHEAAVPMPHARLHGYLYRTYPLSHPILVVLTLSQDDQFDGSSASFCRILRD